MRITRCVRKLEAYTPGEQPKAKNVVKLNTNENPYPPSPKCANVLRGFDLDRLRRYPDPVFLALREELAKLNHCRSEQIFIGNGSDEILALAAKCFVEDDECIGSLDPSYSLYQKLADIRNVPWVGCEVAKPLPAKLALFLWTNPNAPTGEFAEPKAIAAFAMRSMAARETWRIRVPLASLRETSGAASSCASASRRSRARAARPSSDFSSRTDSALKSSASATSRGCGAAEPTVAASRIVRITTCCLFSP